MPYKDPEKRRQYNRDYHKRWYHRNKSQRISQVQQRKRQIREWMRQLKEGMSCVKCGLSGMENAWALEFHHKNHEDKETIVSSLVSAGASKKKILAEIAKCDVICSNCHRKEHYQQHRDAVEKGEKSIWVKAGEAGAENMMFAKDMMTSSKRRRRNRRKTRGKKGKSGPERECNDDIDTFLRKLEKGATLSEGELKRFRHLIGRQEKGWQMEGETEEFVDIESDTDINRDSSS